ncbi:cobalt transporter subunit [Gammaproteobacteria bacterium 45_16_T64]|nr:cobalt transporter subunit [Gammaproteobacteria bacterium 45_16_T64]
MQQQAVSTPQSKPLTLSTAIQVVGALALGAALLFAVGFAPMDVAHNAAHDARHAFAFPCH